MSASPPAPTPTFPKIASIYLPLEATYRAQIGHLDSLATPPPWINQVELYGVETEGIFRALGFSPHRPADCRLIATYRNSLPLLVEAINALSAQCNHPRLNFSPVVALRQILQILDTPTSAHPISLRSTLYALDKSTTQPPWDPAHIALGMDFSPVSPEIVAPSFADPALIALSRLAVPYALKCLADSETLISGLPASNPLSESQTHEFQTILTNFDSHSVNKGLNTSTV